MTFSLLARDEKTGALVAAAATGAPCVGGWVIRGALGAGLVASQGTAPSTLWRDEVLRRMGQGDTAPEAVSEVTAADPGRGHRQIGALDTMGRAAAFTGKDSVAMAAHETAENCVVAGNMLAEGPVLVALREAWERGSGDPAERVLAALRAAADAGGDARGLQSAALLVLHPSFPPLDLRIDLSESPLADLATLLRTARTPPYADWLKVVPVADDPHRAPVTAPPAAG